MEIQINPARKVSKAPTKDDYRAIALASYQEHVKQFLSFGFDQRHQVLPVEIGMQVVAEEIFNTLNSDGDKKYLYIEPTTLKFNVSYEPLPGLLYICTYNPEADITPWLVTNCLRKLGIKYFIQYNKSCDSCKDCDTAMGVMYEIR